MEASGSGVSKKSKKDEIDPERQAVRDEISKMSIEEILELKEKIGSKVFDQGLGFSRAPSYKDRFKRENKNRPRMEPIAKRGEFKTGKRPDFENIRFLLLLKRQMFRIMTFPLILPGWYIALHCRGRTKNFPTVVIYCGLIHIQLR